MYLDERYAVAFLLKWLKKYILRVYKDGRKK